MATLWIREFDASGRAGVGAVPVLNEAANTRSGAVPIGATSVQSDPFLRDTRLVSVQADQNCWVEFSFNPGAAVGKGERIGKDQPPRVFGVTGNDMLAVITE